jgi:[ribosomal protein S18]-alanine N-acetyltransferase
VSSYIKNKPAPPDVQFSFAAASDIDALLTIENQSFLSPWPRQHFKSELEQPHSFTLLAQKHVPSRKTIVGYIIFWLIIDEMHILNLAVQPRYRRQAIARGLILEALRLAQINHCLTAWLEVRPSNRAALTLYQSLGFKLVMTRKRYYNDTGEDALILSLSLT